MRFIGRRKAAGDLSSSLSIVPFPPLTPTTCFKMRIGRDVCVCACVCMCVCSAVVDGLIGQQLKDAVVAVQLHCIADAGAKDHHLDFCTCNVKRRTG